MFWFPRPVVGLRTLKFSYQVSAVKALLVSAFSLFKYVLIVLSRLCFSISHWDLKYMIIRVNNIAARTDFSTLFRREKDSSYLVSKKWYLLTVYSIQKQEKTLLDPSSYPLLPRVQKFESRQCKGLGFKTWLWNKVVWGWIWVLKPWASSLTSLYLSFFTSENGEHCTIDLKDLLQKQIHIIYIKAFCV